MFGSKKRRIIKNADVISSKMEEMNSLSWGRVLDIAKDLQHNPSVTDARILSDELILIAQTNLSMFGRMGVMPVPMAGQLKEPPRELTEEEKRLASQETVPIKTVAENEEVETAASDIESTESDAQRALDSLYGAGEKGEASATTTKKPDKTEVASETSATSSAEEKKSPEAVAEKSEAGKSTQTAPETKAAEADETGSGFLSGITQRIGYISSTSITGRGGSKKDSKPTSTEDSSGAISFASESLTQQFRSLGINDVNHVVLPSGVEVIEGGLVEDMLKHPEKAQAPLTPVTPAPENPIDKEFSDALQADFDVIIGGKRKWTFSPRDEAAAHKKTRISRRFGKPAEPKRPVPIIESDIKVLDPVTGEIVPEAVQPSADIAQHQGVESTQISEPEVVFAEALEPVLAPEDSKPEAAYETTAEPKDISHDSGVEIEASAVESDGASAAVSEAMPTDADSASTENTESSEEKTVVSPRHALADLLPTVELSAAAHEVTTPRHAAPDQLWSLDEDELEEGIADVAPDATEETVVEVSVAEVEQSSEVASEILADEPVAESVEADVIESEDVSKPEEPVEALESDSEAQSEQESPVEVFIEALPDVADNSSVEVVVEPEVEAQAEAEVSAKAELELESAAQDKVVLEAVAVSEVADEILEGNQDSELAVSDDLTAEQSDAEEISTVADDTDQERVTESGPVESVVEVTLGEDTVSGDSSAEVEAAECKQPESVEETVVTQDDSSEVDEIADTSDNSVELDDVEASLDGSSNVQEIQDAVVVPPVLTGIVSEFASRIEPLVEEELQASDSDSIAIDDVAVDQAAQNDEAEIGTETKTKTEDGTLEDVEAESTAEGESVEHVSAVVDTSEADAFEVETPEAAEDVAEEELSSSEKTDELEPLAVLAEELISEGVSEEPQFKSAYEAEVEAIVQMVAKSDAPKVSLADRVKGFFKGSRRSDEHAETQTPFDDAQAIEQESEVLHETVEVPVVAEESVIKSYVPEPEEVLQADESFNEVADDISEIAESEVEEIAMAEDSSVEEEASVSVDSAETTDEPAEIEDQDQAIEFEVDEVVKQVEVLDELEAIDESDKSSVSEELESTDEAKAAEQVEPTGEIKETENADALEQAEESDITEESSNAEEPELVNETEVIEELEESEKFGELESANSTDESALTAQSEEFVELTEPEILEEPEAFDEIESTELGDEVVDLVEPDVQEESEIHEELEVTEEPEPDVQANEVELDEVSSEGADSQDVESTESTEDSAEIDRAAEEVESDLASDFEAVDESMQTEEVSEPDSIEPTEVFTDTQQIDEEVHTETTDDESLAQDELIVEEPTDEVVTELRDDSSDESLRDDDVIFDSMVAPEPVFKPMPSQKTSFADRFAKLFKRNRREDDRTTGFRKQEEDDLIFGFADDELQVTRDGVAEETLSPETFEEPGTLEAVESAASSEESEAIVEEALSSNEDVESESDGLAADEGVSEETLNDEAVEAESPEAQVDVAVEHDDVLISEDDDDIAVEAEQVEETASELTDEVLEEVIVESELDSVEELSEEPAEEASEETSEDVVEAIAEDEAETANEEAVETVSENDAEDASGVEASVTETTTEDTDDAELSEALINDDVEVVGDVEIAVFEETDENKDDAEPSEVEVVVEDTTETSEVEAIEVADERETLLHSTVEEMLSDLRSQESVTSEETRKALSLDLTSLGSKGSSQTTPAEAMQEALRTEILGGAPSESAGPRIFSQQDLSAIFGDLDISASVPEELSEEVKATQLSEPSDTDLETESASTLEGVNGSEASAGEDASEEAEAVVDAESQETEDESEAKDQEAAASEEPKESDEIEGSEEPSVKSSLEESTDLEAVKDSEEEASSEEADEDEADDDVEARASHSRQSVEAYKESVESEFEEAGESKANASDVDDDLENDDDDIFATKVPKHASLDFNTIDKEASDKEVEDQPGGLHAAEAVEKEPEDEAEVNADADASSDSEESVNAVVADDEDFDDVAAFKKASRGFHAAPSSLGFEDEAEVEGSAKSPAEDDTEEYDPVAEMLASLEPAKKPSKKTGKKTGKHAEVAPPSRKSLRATLFGEPEEEKGKKAKKDKNDKKGKSNKKAKKEKAGKHNKSGYVSLSDYASADDAKESAPEDPFMTASFGDFAQPGYEVAKKPEPEMYEMGYGFGYDVFAGYDPYVQEEEQQQVSEVSASAYTDAISADVTAPLPRIVASEDVAEPHEEETAADEILWDFEEDYDFEKQGKHSSMKFGRHSKGFGKHASLSFDEPLEEEFSSELESDFDVDDSEVVDDCEPAHAKEDLPSDMGTFHQFYESRDGELAVYEDEDGHLVSVKTSRLS